MTDTKLEFLYLYGSVTSPYVRRLRLLLDGQDYNFVNLNIYEKSDREKLQQVSPIMKIPVLKHRHQVIWDSRQIFEYCVELGLHHKLTWEEQNILTAIDGAQDSLINLMLLKRAQVTLPSDSGLATGHRERLQLILPYLSDQLKKGTFSNWNYLAFALLSFIDWTIFREMWDLSGHKEFLNFVEQNYEREIVKTTNPRL